MDRLKLMAVSLATIWVVIASLILWQNFASDYRDFLHADAPNLEAAPRFDINNLTIVHYLDDSCSCNRFAEPHVSELRETYPHVQHLVVNADSQLDEKEKALAKWAISSPSLSIINQNGSLLYYGPYTSGMVCGEGEDFVKAELTRNEKGDEQAFINVLNFGCYCPWKTTPDKAIGQTSI